MVAMCPMCISAVTWIAAGAVSTSTGGIAAVVVSKFRSKRREDNVMHKEEDMEMAKVVNIKTRRNTT
jgi:hypothetical protein